MKEDAWTRRTPMMMSAFVCPGAGQVMQKRWFAAAFFFMGAVVPAVVFIVGTVRWMITNLQNVIDWRFEPTDRTIVPYHVSTMVLCFVVSMLFYFGGIFDTWAAQMRMVKRAPSGGPPPLPRSTG